MAKNTITHPMYTLNCKGKMLVIDTPLVMGIINVTGDSFYKSDNADGIDGIVAAASEMVKAGVDILDIGGQSTRPGSKRITAEEELARVIPAVKAIHESFPGIIISIDTYYAKVAAEAVNAGASIVNDISSGDMDAAMITTVASLRVPYVCMHMQGTPETMQQDPQYNDVTEDVMKYFVKKVEQCRSAGIIDIILDPGFGFGKTAMHNFKLLSDLSLFRMFDCPVLAGLSRKGTIYKTLSITADEALNGTTVMNTLAILNGASILRVHDVKEAREVITLLTAYKKAAHIQ